MQRIVLDTNVLVSALIGKGNPKRILELILAGSIKICLSDSVFQEYTEVLKRPKFFQYVEFHANAQKVLNSLYAIAEIIEPTEQLRQHCPDKDDDKFLELAIASTAQFLVTGNLKHFPQNLKSDFIVSPSRYLQLLRKDS